MEINNECNEHSKENINITSNQELPKKYIKCPECGEAILMVPTLGEMIASIENHIVSHKTHPHTDLKVPHLRAPAIQLDLAQQAILQASDITTPAQKPSIWL
jgi:hypothetical protein